MKKILCTTLLFFSLLVSPQILNAGEWSSNINIFLGVKLLDKDDWGKFDDQFELGLLADVKKIKWPVSLVANLIFSIDSTSDYDDSWKDDRYRYTYRGEEAYTAELNLGIKKIWSLPKTWNFYIAGGGAVIYGGAEVTRSDNLNGYYLDTDDEDDFGLGYWGALGVYKTIGRKFNLGLDMRYSNAKIRLYHEDRDAGGMHIGLILGFCWGGREKKAES